MVGLLGLEDIMELRADLKLVVRGQDLDLLELVILLLDSTELNDSEDTQVDWQDGEDYRRKQVSKPHWVGVTRHFERNFGNNAVIALFPVDIEAVLADEDLAKRPIVASIVSLGDIRVLVDNIPQTQIAEGRSEKLVNFREKFKLWWAERVENMLFTLALVIDLYRNEVDRGHARVISALALALVEGQERLGEREVVLVVLLEVCHLRADPREEVGLHVWVNAGWQVNALSHGRQTCWLAELREENWAWLDLWGVEIEVIEWEL